MFAIRKMMMAVAFLTSASALAQPFAWTVNSDDEFNADQLLRVNLATGEFEFVGPLPATLGDVEGLAFDPAGQLYAVDNASKTLVRVDPTSAATENIANRLSNLGFLPTQALDLGMTFSCDGQLLMVAEQTQSLYEVDTETGQAQVIGTSGGLDAAMTAIASFGSSIFALAAETNGLYRIDRESGKSMMVATLDGDPITDAGMAFDEAGNLWVVADGSGVDGSGIPIFQPSRLMRINVETGAVVQSSFTRTGLESLAIASPGPCVLGTPGTIVPTLSPVSLVIMALLLALIGWRFRPLV